ncbi:hypothetical protein B0174_03650 [Arcobacter caeni]|uniref:Tyr recombinase domain-containing protein n=2 Tax=Arcobacter caeni TaxID=1912877 RepID=A0A363D252_9BACT|nr:hypothetical protein B0174_03650 [Arcobacter caeni]
MKLIKTEIPGVYYLENKQNITYYFSYKDPITKITKRKKLFSEKEHLTKHLKKCVIMSNEIKETLKNYNSSEIIENQEFKNYISLNELTKIYFEDRINTKKRILKEKYNHLTNEEFENNVLIKKQIYNVTKELLRINKNIQNSKISQININRITKIDIKEYIENDLFNTNLSQKSKFMVISQIKTIFNYGIKNEIINIKNPFEYLKFQNPQRTRKRVLSEEEITLLLKTLKKEENINLYLCVYLGVLTGSRSNTVLNIKKNDIDTKNKTINLNNFKTNKFYKIGISETGTKWIEEKILPFRENDEYLIKSDFNEKNNIKQTQILANVQKKVYEIMNTLFNENINKKNNYERDNVVNFHTIRRSISTNLVKNGANVYNVMKFLNHSSIDQTMKYLNLENHEINNDVNNLMNNIFKDF